MSDDTRRLFFALWPDDDARAQLACAAGGVELHRAARRVPPEKMHVTLAFLGNTSPDQQRCFEKAADDVKGKPFRLILDHFGHFPRPQVFWLGPTEYPEVLGLLVKHLVSAIQACGFEPEPRTYRPHVTVARKVRARPETGPVSVQWSCDGFFLVESAGGKYSVLRRWPLE